MTEQEIIKIFLDEKTLEDKTEVEKTLQWMHANETKIPKKTLHKALEIAIKNRYEDTLDLLVLWNKVTKDDFWGFLDNQLHWKYSEKKTEEKGDSKEDSNVAPRVRYQISSDRDLETGIALLPTGDTDKQEKGLKGSPEAIRGVQNKEAIGIQFDYSNLVCNSSNESTALKSMIDIIPNGKEILKHPVVEAFIMMKWFKFFWIWAMWMFAKLLFIIFFVCYGFEVLSNSELTENNCQTTERKDFSSPMLIMTLILWLWFVIFEMVTIVNTIHLTNRDLGAGLSKNPKNCLVTFFRSMRKYIDTRNILQIYIFGSISVLLFTNDCWTNHTFFSLTCPIMCFELLFEFGYHPSLYKYIHMFLSVMRSYVKILLIYLPIILGFCFGFYQMYPLPEKDEEKGFPSTLFSMFGKIFVMLLGEIDYMDIPIEDDGWRMFFFFMFLISITLALLNLLNAVAITDTGAMIKEAEKDVLYNILVSLESWENTLVKRKLTIFHSYKSEANKSAWETIFKCCHKILQRPSSEDQSTSKTVFFKVFENEEQNKIKKWLWRYTFGLKNSLSENQKIKTFFENPQGPQFIVSNRIADEAKRILMDRTEQVSGK